MATCVRLARAGAAAVEQNKAWAVCIALETGGEKVPRHRRKGERGASQKEDPPKETVRPWCCLAKWSTEG